MTEVMEVPKIQDLADLPVDVVRADSPGVVTVTAIANDGSTVAVTWDEIASSVHIRCLAEDIERLLMEREGVSKISVRVDHDELQFWIWSIADGLAGELVVRVGRQVHVTDALLRT